MPEIVQFTLYDAITGAPLPGIDCTFASFRRREQNGSYTDLAPGPAISNVEIASVPTADYVFEVDAALILPGTIIRYVIDCTTAAAARYLDGEIRSSDSGITEGLTEVGTEEELVLDVGDQAPPFAFVLRDQDGKAIDLSSGSPAVTFSMWPAEGGDPVVDAISVTIIDAANGKVRVDWPLEASAAAGSFLAKFELTQNSVVSHHPVNRAIVVRVVKVAP